MPESDSDGGACRWSTYAGGGDRDGYWYLCVCIMVRMAFALSCRSPLFLLSLPGRGLVIGFHYSNSRSPDSKVLDADVRFCGTSSCGHRASRAVISIRTLALKRTTPMAPP